MSLPRSFRFYLVSRFFAATAMTMFRAAVAWHVFALSQSAFHLGLLGFVQFLPAFGLSLVAGAAADAYDRRKVMTCAQAVAMLCVLVLFGVTQRGSMSLPLLYAGVFAAGAALAFDSPSRAALLPALVTRDEFPRAVTIASTAQALAFATGPALCGLIVAAAGIQATYALYGAFALASLGALAFVHPRVGDEVRRGISVEAIREGLAFVWSRPVVLGCMTLDMFAVIFAGASALLPVYAEKILHVGARGYGVLAAALEAGALLTSLALAFLPPIKRSGRALLFAVGAYGLATIAFGLSRSYPLSVLAYMAVGIADQVSVVMRSTMIQLSTPDELRGRVSSVNFIFIGASNQLGAVESGFVAALSSAPFAVVSGGVACLVVLAVVALRIPSLRDYRIGG